MQQDLSTIIPKNTEWRFQGRSLTLETSLSYLIEESMTVIKTGFELPPFAMGWTEAFMEKAARKHGNAILAELEEMTAFFGK